MTAALLRAAIRAIGWLPLPLGRALGWAGGQLLWLLPNRVRATTRANVERCYPALATAARRRLVRRSLGHLGQTLVDSCWTWSRSGAAIRRAVVAVEGGELLDEARRSKQGVILVSPHIGCWEMVGAYCAQRLALTALYRPPRLAAMEAVVTAGRQRTGARLVPTDARGIRALHRALRAGEAIGILPDQAPRPGQGVIAPFFGQPVRTMTLLSRLARSSDARVLICVMERLPRGNGFRLHVRAAGDAIKAAEETRAAAAVNREVERSIALCPEQYMWSYRRFRRTGRRGDGGEK